MGLGQLGCQFRKEKKMTEAVAAVARARASGGEKAGAAPNPGYCARVLRAALDVAAASAVARRVCAGAAPSRNAHAHAYYARYLFKRQHITKGK